MISDHAAPRTGSGSGMSQSSRIRELKRAGSTGKAVAEAGA
jgi:hypothetical protein